MTEGAKSPVEAAIAQFLQALQESEGMALKGGKGVKVEIEAEDAGKGDMEECPMCAAGTCDNPDHMGEEDVAGLAEAYR